jgi:hypothetical protein
MFERGTLFRHALEVLRTAEQPLMTWASIPRAPSQRASQKPSGENLDARSAYWTLDVAAALSTSL